MDVTCVNGSMTGCEVRTLYMRAVSHKTAGEYDCLHNSVSTDPKKLVKELTKIKNKLKKIVQNLPLTLTSAVSPDLQVRPERQRINATN